MDFVPTEYVDITEEMELKEKMFACHESQIVWLMDHDGQDERVKTRNSAEYRGFQCGVKYAEGFKCCYAAGRMTAKRLLP
jgi:LmbE family N-acetylglucosaminyl deacetylase